MEFQSIEEFEREHAASVYAENVRRAALTANPKPKKQKKPDLSPVDAQLEQDAVNEIGSENWVGKLHEYRQAHHVPGEGLNYMDEMSSVYATPRATSLVVIAESPDRFGGVWFSNKKTARQYAAKKAIDWLIANQKMPADGSVSFPKQTVVTPTSTSASAAVGEPVTALIPELAHRLGFNVPRYEIVAQTPGVPLYDGWAEFNDPRIDGRVGQVSTVHGKKNARDQIAKEVYTFLKDIERQRLAAAS